MISYFFKGPPIFVNKIENKQYGHPGKMFNLAFVVYTKSEIDCYTVKRENNHDVTASMQITSLNTTLIFHGTEISVEAIEVVLSFKLSGHDNSNMYSVTLCNGHGNNSVLVEIKPVKVGKIFFTYSFFFNHLEKSLQTGKKANSFIFSEFSAVMANCKIITITLQSDTNVQTIV